MAMNSFIMEIGKRDEEAEYIGDRKANLSIFVPFVKLGRDIISNADVAKTGTLRPFNAGRSQVTSSIYKLLS